MSKRPLFSDDDAVDVRYVNIRKAVNEYTQPARIHCESLWDWVKSGVVKPEEAFIIAINPRSLGFEDADTTSPRILQAAYAVGDPYFTINRKTMKVVDFGYHVRDVIKKVSEAEVRSGVFLQEQYLHVSGLLCSRVDAVNRPETMGADFQLVPNPHAKNPVPDSFRLDGAYYRASKDDDSSYDVRRE